MSETKCYTECKTTELTRFHLLKENKWKKLKKQLSEGNMDGKGLNKVRTMNKEVLKEKAINNNANENEDISTKVKLTKAIKVIAKNFYEKKHERKEGPIYEFENFFKKLNQA
ncbi:7513_t:CDS:2 [Funneliformis geosporum]|nr:7513_t:CDS:2 [Funneliformis geosporum]